MKLFAIAPDTMTRDQLLAALPELLKRGATHLYLRPMSLKKDIAELITSAGAFGIVPIVPYVLFKRDIAGSCGVHFKSSELSLLVQHAPPDAVVITASSLVSDDVHFALQSGAQYVYVSPVFPPFSKPDDGRHLVPRDTVQKLVSLYGERIVLLGGMTQERVQSLKESIAGDFSIAGITLFFKDASAGRAL